MSLFVVRHAKAGQRSGWDGDDLLRPLSASGRKQADALAERLAPERPSALYASPYVRCVQTLEPLGSLLGIDIMPDERLTEGASLEGALELLGEVADRAVLCSHGDVIPELLGALARRGMRVTGPPDWRKATVWVLDRAGDGDVIAGGAEPPPGADPRQP
ncbi:MAG: histidine phosphatase family protein [Actinomycetota bacterium]|nr:histidine phosphatase family protein [Actinomycetota bacterium]